MTAEKRARLEAAGYAVSDTIGEILGMSEADRQVVEFRTTLARKVRALRKGRGLTQQQLAAVIGISQSRIPGIESGKASLDPIATVIFALGGTLEDPISDRTNSSNTISRRRRSPRSTGPLVRPRFMARRKRSRIAESP